MRYTAFRSSADLPDAVSNVQACLAALPARASCSGPPGPRARACSPPALLSAAVGPNLQSEHT